MQQGYPSQGQAPYPGGQAGKGMPPPGGQPRRHPDFANKDQPPQPYSPYNQPRPAIYPGKQDIHYVQFDVSMQDHLANYKLLTNLPVISVYCIKTRVQQNGL